MLLLFFSGAPCAREVRERSTITKIIWQTIHPRNFSYDVIVRSSVRTFRVVESSPARTVGVGESRDFLAGNRMAQRRPITSCKWF